MKNFHPNSGQYVVYSDHSTSGTGSFTFQSTADPVSLANVFHLPIITTRPFPKVNLERKTLAPAEPALEIFELEYEAMDEVQYDSELRRGGITPKTSIFQAMVASEEILAKDWDNPAEDETWADL